MKNMKKFGVSSRSFSTHKMHFVFLFSLDPSYFQSFLTFSFLVHFKRFKMLQECHLQFYKRSLNSNSNMFCVFGNWLCSVLWFVFFEFLTPYTLGGCNFLISNPSLMNFSASSASKKVFKFCWDTKNNKAFPLDLACPERLNVRSFAILP